MLTKSLRGGNIYKLSTRDTQERAKRVKKSRKQKDLKKSQKTFKKVLTKEKECDILFELSSREGKRLDLEN